MNSSPALLRRCCHDHDEPRDVPRISFANTVRQNDDPYRILPYLAGLGLSIRTLDDLLQINADATEEEIHSFRVVEGVAATLARAFKGLPWRNSMTPRYQSA